MKREIVQITDDVIQITIADERFYAIEQTSTETGEISTVYYPSVTRVCSFYPKGVGFYKWLADKGWDEAEEIKAQAGTRGSKIHSAIGHLVDGEEVRYDSMVLNPDSGEREELTRDEFEAVLSFAEWYKLADVRQVFFREKTVFSHEHRYAGTIDFLCYCGNPEKVRGQPSAMPGYNLIDFKTSQQIWPSMELQVSAYLHAMGDYLKTDIPEALGAVNLGILQIGYRKNQRGWKYSAVPDRFDLFMAVRKIWEHEAGGEKPKVLEIPTSVRLLGAETIAA